MSLNPTEQQQTSRPSSAGSNHDDEQMRFQRPLSTLNEEENKQSNNSQPIIWDDPFELLITNEQTGRIGISVETFPSSPNSRCMLKNHSIESFISVCCSVKNINFTNTCSITQTTR
jgi:hypothetical protein